MFSFISSAERERGISPVIGAVLTVIVVTLLAAVTSAMVFGLFEETEAPPQAELDVQSIECGYALVHETGDPIGGEQVEIRGVEETDALADEQLTAGDRQQLEPTDDEITIIWEGAGGDTHRVATFEVNTTTTGDYWVCGGGTIYTAESGSVDSIAGDNGTTTSLSATTDAAALGPASRDLTGDGRDDIPFATSSGRILLTNSSNETTLIANDSDIPGNIEYAKTRLGVGTWNGSGTSVFFANQNHDTLYRVTPDGTPQTVATPGNGVQAVSGIGDIDGDGTDELVFADGSQDLRYLEPNGSIEKLDNFGTGQNNGIGAGSLADFDGDGNESVVFVDGSNDVKLTGEGTITFSGTEAKKASPTATDVDGDDADEIVYVGNANGNVKYIDDVGGGNDIKYLTDDDGNRIDGSDNTGVT